MTTMKKIVPVLIGATLMATLMTGCGVSVSGLSKVSESYNGVTKTVTTDFKNGKTVKETVYTDDDGNVMDQEAGEAAYEAAKSSDATPMNYEVETEDESVDEADEVDEVDDEVYSGTLTLVNDTDSDITELYAALEENEFGDNMLQDGAVLEAGEECTTSLTYTADTAFKLAFVTSDGESETFDNFTFGNRDNPEDVVLTITEDAGSFTMNLN